MARRLKISDRDALAEWNEIKADILRETTVDASETEAAKIKRIARLEADPEAWFKYYFPNYCTAEPAAFHKRATKRLLANSRWYEVRAWSRELAKSTRAMMEVTMLALTRQVKNVLLISNSQDNAERLLMPLMLNFESNQRIKNDYGNQQLPGHWETGEFVTAAGCAFCALGAGQSPRGTRNENYRPDFIWVDDIDTDEETRNPERIKKKWNWIEQALIPTISISGNYRILFCGNIIAKYCCITLAIEKARFVDVVNIRDKNGKSSWPEKNSETDIDQVLANISNVSAQKEYYNNPLSEGDVFKEITWAKIPHLNWFKFIVVYGDPAPSNSKNGKGSFKSVFAVGFHEGKYYIITGFLDHVTNAEFVQWYYALRDYVAAKTQVYNFIENNTLQDPFFEQVFIPLFTEAAKTKGFIGITPDQRVKPDKFSRVEGNLEPLNRFGKLVFNEKEKENPHMKRLAEQFLTVNPQLTAPIDGPDCIEGAVWVINEKTSEMAGDAWRSWKAPRNKKRI